MESKDITEFQAEIFIRLFLIWTRKDYFEKSFPRNFSRKLFGREIMCRTCRYLKYEIDSLSCYSKIHMKINSV